MNDFIPAFDWGRVVIDPWTVQFESTFWIVLMGFLATAACGLIGNYLILRRMALVGDAISHSVLPGLAVAFLFSGSLHIGSMFAGAIAAGVLTTLLIEVIHTKSRVKSDAAIGITFCSLFALGVILINMFAGKIHLDTECVLYGEISYVPLETSVKLLGGALELGPRPVVTMAAVFLVVVGLIILLYKELLVCSFDPALAASLGIPPKVFHYSLMVVLSIVVVSAFESVGAILVIAMLILPGATSQLLSTRLPVVMFLSVGNALVSAVLGYHLGVWMRCSIAGAMVVAAAGLFLLAWFFSPGQGLVQRWRRAGRVDNELDADAEIGGDEKSSM